MDKRFEKIDHEISLGRLWRAKEHLQGMLRGKSYDVDLFEKMGLVLLHMGDDREAGKFLFLSGVRNERNNVGIEIFITRSAKSSFTEFWAAMPACAKYGDYSSLPQTVQTELNALDFDEKTINLTFRRFAEEQAYREKHRQSFKEKSTWKNQFVGWLLLAIAILLAIGLLYQAGLGLYTIWAYF